VFDAHATPLNAFAVELGFVLLSTRNETDFDA
jgi:hypothetical protein